MLWQAKANTSDRKWLDHPKPKWRTCAAGCTRELKFRRQGVASESASGSTNHQYRRVDRRSAASLTRWSTCEELARSPIPTTTVFARGGEGHLEVAKNIYYTVHKKAHMVLSLKPFGCMPSSQSDGVQSAVMNHFKDMIFLPIETSGEGEINAHSRVQMALGEAKAKAKLEFQQALESTGKRLEDDPSYVAEHPELRHRSTRCRIVTASPARPRISSCM